MIEKICQWALKNRFLVAVLTLLLIGAGFRAMQSLPIDAFPDVTNVQVQVLTSSPALGPEEVEQFITTPVEQAMSGLPDLLEVRSVSKFGLSAVTVVFKDGTNIYFARQLVGERLQAAREAIPEGYGDPELGPVSTGLGEIYQFEVRGEGKTAMELRDILDWEIAPRLRKVTGVIEINTFGGELRTYQVQVHPERLAAFDLTLEQVFEALEQNNANAGGAYIEKNSEQYLIRGEGLVRTLEDLGNIVVDATDDGTPIYVRQVADLTFAPLVRQGAVTRDGRGEAVTGIVMMLMGANSRQVVVDVKQTLADMKPQLAKLGVEVDPFYDRAELVDKTVHTVGKNLLEGGVLVIGVLLLMLLNLRAGLIAAAAIPLSMLFGFIAMRYFGVSGNLMSLGAIDFGLIVDGSVIVIENAVRLIAERNHELGRPVDRAERSRLVLRASHEVLRSATFGVLIIAIVYLPILSLAGIEGKMFRPMAMTVLFVLGGSLLLMLTLIPVLAAMFLPRKIRERESPIVAVARLGYLPLLRGCLRFRWIPAVVAVVLLVASGLAGRTLGAEFMPRLGEGAIAVQAARLPSVSLEESIRQTTEIERVLKQFPEVVTVVSKTGRAEIATDPMGAELTDILVMLKPPSQWKTASTQQGLIEKFDQALQRNLAGTTFSYSQPIELRVSELISGVRSDVAVKIFGDDLGTLARTADRAVAVLSKVAGAADVKAQQIAGLPVLRVRVDRHAIARYGINAKDVLDAVSTLGGRDAGVVLDGSRRFAVQVRFAPEDRRDIGQISALRVRAPGGQSIPLAQLADLSVEDGPAEISHEGGRRRITVEMNVRGRDLAGFVGDAKRAMADADVIPAGAYVEWGGQFQNLEEATRRLAIAVPVALLLIFMLLYASQGSAKLAALVYLNVPFAITGGVFSLWGRGMPLSISAGVGFISLFGVAVLTGLVLVGEMKRCQDGGADAATAAYQGAAVKLRAILTVALVAALGFIPMAVATGAGAEVQKPLATVVIGGIITSTLLTLLVLPAAYAWLFRGKGQRVGTLADDAGSASEPIAVVEPVEPSEPTEVSP
ncbi:MAG TPA: CusA/CzcA family heavy metal efflux RND transporter [Kofleriaceae bacterium]|nr:CusA/CzcA family heavy metal efflux RND transporter [Kofleriaceae bacterium]